MDIANRTTKLYLKSLAPNEAIDLIDSCNLPSPYREILIAICVKRLRTYQAMDYIENEYNIVLEFWTFNRRLKVALDMFRKSVDKLD